MDNNSLVSIIVPIYKVEKYLDECILSLVNQTYMNLEIILVDDGSPDNCPAICDMWKERDDRIKVIHKENGGVSEARNVGIKMSCGEWLLFVDSDDVIPFNFVDLLVAAATDEKCLVVSGKERFKDVLPKYETLNIPQKLFGKDLILKRDGLYCWGALYNKRLVDKLDLKFDISLKNVEDVVWNGIYMRYITEVVCVNVPYFYRMNPSSITSNCSNYKWQIYSWIAARRSIMNWFTDKCLTTTQQKEVVEIFRHCQNNIHAECVAGKISYVVFNEIENQDGTQFCDALIPAMERLFRRYLPKLYFKMYILLIRLKNIMRR